MHINCLKNVNLEYVFISGPYFYQAGGGGGGGGGETRKVPALTLTFENVLVI